MNDYINQLLRISSAGIAPAGPVTGMAHAGPVLQQLYEMLQQRNGFYTFESALHVFPATPVPGQYSLQQWNEPALWIDSYGDLAKGCFFFAEDIFGGQFAIRENRIYLFEPETAAPEHVADSLEGWAKALLENYNYLTGYPAAHEWQQVHGALPAGSRLAPKTPFVGGGAFDITNLYIAEPVQLMRFRGMIAQKIKDLPEGARIRFTVTK